MNCLQDGTNWPDPNFGPLCDRCLELIADYFKARWAVDSIVDLGAKAQDSATVDNSIDKSDISATININIAPTGIARFACGLQLEDENETS